ncbi:MAG: hypothetical protein PHE89_03315 [Alphaproteobacteria bacterium]|nr:hypothetical protein [Alphaproteobacteria bacterium]
MVFAEDYNIPEIDCNRTRNKIEMTMCSNPDLLEKEKENLEWLAKIYIYSNKDIKTIKNSPDFVRNQSYKLDCSSFADEKACVADLFNKNIEYLKNRALVYELREACEQDVCDFSKVEKLMEEGADLNGYTHKDCQISDPVFYGAFARENTKTLEYVIEKGARIGGELRSDCRHAGELNFIYSYDDLLILLKNGANINAVNNNHYEIPKSGIERTTYRPHNNKIKNSPLTQQIYGNILNKHKYPERYKIILKLIEEGADVNLKGAGNTNAIDVLFMGDFTANDYETVEEIADLLFSKNVDVSKKHKGPLYWLNKNQTIKNEQFSSKYRKILIERGAKDEE